MLCILGAAVRHAGQRLPPLPPDFTPARASGGGQQTLPSPPRWPPRPRAAGTRQMAGPCPPSQSAHARARAAPRWAPPPGQCPTSAKWTADLHSAPSYSAGTGVKEARFGAARWGPNSSLASADAGTLCQWPPSKHCCTCCSLCARATHPRRLSSVINAARCVRALREDRWRCQRPVPCCSARFGLTKMHSIMYECCKIGDPGVGRWKRSASGSGSAARAGCRGVSIKSRASYPNG